MSVDCFDVLSVGDDAGRIAKREYDEKIAAATYDVREKHGEWLFGAATHDAFDDRFKLSYDSIARTIDKVLPARTSSIKKVARNLEREWRQRQACYPGCESNEAHAKKFHKDKADKGDEKEASRRQGTGEWRNNPLVPHGHDWSEEEGRFVSDPTAEPLAEGQRDPRRPKRDIWDATEEAHPSTRQAAEDGAYERSQPEHPEQHLQQTFRDHQGEELIPEGNFEGYKNRVDQGGPAKVDSHDFIPGANDHPHNESDSDNFVPTVTGRRAGLDDPAHRGPEHAQAMDSYLKWLESDDPQAKFENKPNVPPGFPDVSRQGSREFQLMARMLHADDMTGNDPNAGASAMGMTGSPGASIGGAPPTPGAAAGGMQAPAPGGSPAAMPTAVPGAPPPVTASREYQAARYLLAMDKAHDWAVRAIQQDGTIVARQRLVVAAHRAGVITDADFFGLKGILGSTRRLADRNYLQQADEAITKVLNEKAEEFQNTIAPLQQALVTIQQAEQLQNPLNVQPPAGTVNVLPQGAAGGADPAGGAAGGAPAPAGGDPAAAGGQAPQGAGGLGADPAAAALAGQPQQLAASRSWYTQAGRHDFSPEHYQAGEDEMREFGDPGDVRTLRNPPKLLREFDGPRGAMEEELGTPPLGAHRARRQDSRGRRPLDSRRRRADVMSEYEQELQQAPGLPTGGQVDVDNFVQKKKVGPRAQQKLRKNLGLPNGADAPGVSPQSVMPKQRKVKAPAATGAGYGLANKRQGSGLAAPDYVWSKAPTSVKGEFSDRIGSGISPEDAFREMIAEISEHHRQGMIGEHDAHRAANEALGRLMLSRRGRRPLVQRGR